jgi:hypothetical protein
MKTWNIFKEIDGITEIVREVESETKPHTKCGEVAYPKPCVKMHISMADYNPFLAFPSAYENHK